MIERSYYIYKINNKNVYKKANHPRLKIKKKLLDENRIKYAYMTKYLQFFDLLYIKVTPVLHFTFTFRGDKTYLISISQFLSDLQLDLSDRQFNVGLTISRLV